MHIVREDSGDPLLCSNSHLSFCCHTRRPDLYGKLHDHTFKRLLREHVSVTLNTDNRLVSNTTTVKELRLAIEHFSLTAAELKQVRPMFEGPRGPFRSEHSH